MKTVKLAFRMIYKRKCTFLLLVIEMILSMLMFIALVGKLQNIADSQKLINIFNQENAFYFSSYIYYTPGTINLKELLAPVAPNSQFGEIVDVEFLNSEGDNLSAYGYNDTIINYTNIQLERGEWFDTNKEDYEYLPLISIGNQYLIGEIVYLTTVAGDKPITGQVIGIIKENEYITTFMSSGSKNNASLDNIVSSANANFIVPFECEKIPSITKDNIINYHYGTIIIADDGVRDDIYNILSSYGEVSDISSMIKNYAERTRDYFLSNGIGFIVFALLGIAGIGGVNCMLNIVNQRRYTIYFMCGMTSKMCAMIEAIRSGAVIVVSYIVVIFLIYATKVGDVFSLDSYTINFATFIYVLVYMIAIYAVTSLYFVIKLSRQNLIDVYKQKA